MPNTTPSRSASCLASIGAAAQSGQRQRRRHRPAPQAPQVPRPAYCVHCSSSGCTHSPCEHHGSMSSTKQCGWDQCGWDQSWKCRQCGWDHPSTHSGCFWCAPQPKQQKANTRSPRRGPPPKTPPEVYWQRPSYARVVKAPSPSAPAKAPAASAEAWSFGGDADWADGDEWHSAPVDPSVAVVADLRCKVACMQSQLVGMVARGATDAFATAQHAALVAEIDECNHQITATKPTKDQIRALHNAVNNSRKKC